RLTLRVLSNQEGEVARASNTPLLAQEQEPYWAESSEAEKAQASDQSSAVRGDSEQPLSTAIRRLRSGVARKCSYESQAADREESCPKRPRMHNEVADDILWPNVVTDGSTQCTELTQEEERLEQ